MTGDGGAARTHDLRIRRRPISPHEASGCGKKLCELQTNQVNIGAPYPRRAAATWMSSPRWYVRVGAPSAPNRSGARRRIDADHFAVLRADVDPASFNRGLLSGAERRPSKWSGPCPSRAPSGLHCLREWQEKSNRPPRLVAPRGDRRPFPDRLEFHAPARLAILGVGAADLVAHAIEIWHRRNARGGNLGMLAWWKRSLAPTFDRAAIGIAAAGAPPANPLAASSAPPCRLQRRFRLHLGVEGISLPWRDPGSSAGHCRGQAGNRAQPPCRNRAVRSLGQIHILADDHGRRRCIASLCGKDCPVALLEFVHRAGKGSGIQLVINRHGGRHHVAVRSNAARESCRSSIRSTPRRASHPAAVACADLAGRDLIGRRIWPTLA